MSTRDPIVNAQVVLKAASGKKLLDESAITKNNIQQFLPSENAINEAATGLRERGFTTHASHPTLSISGKKSLFEKVFILHLKEKKHNHQSYYVPNKKATIPAPLTNSIDAIVFPEPVESFE